MLFCRVGEWSVRCWSLLIKPLPAHRPPVRRRGSVSRGGNRYPKEKDPRVLLKLWAARIDEIVDEQKAFAIAAPTALQDLQPALWWRRRGSRRGVHFTEKRNSVVERKVSPGRRMVVGKSAWLTESG